MNFDLTQAYAVIAATIRSELMPTADRAHARSQLAGIVDLLVKLGGVSGWDADLLATQAGLLADGEARLAAEFGIAVPEAAPESDVSAAERLEAVEDAFVDFVDTVFDTAGDRTDARQRDLELELASLLQAVLATEKRRIRKSDYSSLS